MIGEFDMCKKETIESKVDLIKTKLFMIFAPNLYKHLFTRYNELREAMDERDEEYEKDMALADEHYAELEKTYKDLLNRYDTLTRNINDLIARVSDM